jgi:hypothetical protein
MTQALTWIAVLFSIALMIWLLVSENDRRKRQTAAEWEREYAAGRGLTTQFIQAGALGLEGIFVAEKQAAIAFKKDEEQGMTKTGTKGDDRDRTEVSDDGES